MDVKFMTLDGGTERQSFLDEWWNSDDHEAAFLQSGDCVYMMPYGHHTYLPFDQYAVKFAGTFRRHTFVARDFELTGEMDGGGYLELAEDRKSCKYTDSSTDYGPVKDGRAVVAAVSGALLR